MIRYATLIRFTDQGARAVGQSPERALAFRKWAAQEEVEVEQQLWTIGSVDGLVVLKGKDEAALLRLLARLEAQGNVRTETLRAFDAGEFSRIAAVPPV